ncbi:cytochrome c-type biogenesis protein [Sulfurivermis fontis]|jgi:cytochrome c-type biogenesis protein CcmH|uniref:cytochrome c-type biogenesis protein n=1 Tax=Sulfurivermis fontis TaxID=1972068 RepID=UPI000FDAF91C|nr:cytochrome c-type biogenesis protein [Sulfurivermis fontis]
MRSLFAIALLLFAVAAQAAISAYRFDTPEQEARFNKLSQELRCLVCQNQNIADSNAGLALDLRRQIHEMILAGKSDAQIIEFMTQRYGDFVLYRPPLRAGTLLLWVGPFVLLLVGGVALAWFVRRRVATTSETPLSEEEQRRLDALVRERGGRS